MNASEMRCIANRVNSGSVFNNLLDDIRCCAEQGHYSLCDPNYCSKSPTGDSTTHRYYSNEDIENLKNMGFQIFETSVPACLDRRDGKYFKISLLVLWGENDTTIMRDICGNLIEWKNPKKTHNRKRK